VLASPATRRPASIDELISSELCARLDRIDILSRKVFAGRLQGERRSKRRGQSVEFEDHRNYVPGDDLRHVDWNVFARLERFFIKIFQEEEDLAFHMVIDATASMDAGTPNKLVFAQRLAMALGYIALVNNDRVAVSAFDGRTIRRLPPARGRRHVQRLAQFLLESIAPAPASSLPAGAAPSIPADGDTDAGPGQGAATDFTGAMRTIAASRVGKGVMVILSDFLIPEGYEAGLRYLGAGAGGGGYDTYCLQILAPAEVDPAGAALAEDPAARPLSGDVRLTDVETGRTADVTITAALLDKYKAAVQAYTERLRVFATARGMSYALVR
jgi:hypothetical protein